MANRTAALKQLLSSDLPLERLGPHLRAACRRAVRSGATDRMLRHARVAVGDLISRGELVAVALDSRHTNHGLAGSLYLVNGSQRVIDLSVLGYDTFKDPAPASPPEPAVTAPTPEPVAKPSFDMKDFGELIVAMERAQDLEIGDPQSADKGIILGSILQLVSRLAPGFRLCVMLPLSEPLPPGQTTLFSPDTDEAANGWIARRQPGHSVWIPSPGELPRHLRRLDGKPFGPDRSAGPYRFRTAVAVPLWEPPAPNGADQPPHETGLLFLIADTDMGRDNMLRLAERISRFVTRRWLHLQTVNLKIHVDTLTGTFNRGYFDTQFGLELERARRSDEPLTLVIADLDKFKSINDTFGHPTGDAILRMVAQRLHEELRRIDHICRVGGEEFALILPTTGEDAAHEVMTRLLDADFRLTATHAGTSQDIPVTFSFGAVTFPAAGSDAAELYRKADDMLYLSKDLGRNRCHFWSSDADPIMLLPTAAAG